MSPLRAGSSSARSDYGVRGSYGEYEDVPLDTSEDITVVMSPRRKMGATIRRLREKRGLTQEALAKRVRVTQGYISQLEAGTKKEISARVAVRLADALDTTVAELL